MTGHVNSAIARGAQVRRFALYNLLATTLAELAKRPGSYGCRSPMPNRFAGGLPLRHSGRASEPESSPGTTSGSSLELLQNCFEKPGCAAPLHGFRGSGRGGASLFETSSEGQVWSRSAILKPVGHEKLSQQSTASGLSCIIEQPGNIRSSFRV